tara:strand:- start:2948 stop:3517 length:570 start_codon:yes stop_codon:yes gene_type:complete
MNDVKNQIEYLQNEIDDFLKHNLITLQQKYFEYRTWNCNQYARTILEKTNTSSVGATTISRLEEIKPEEIPRHLKAIILESSHKYYMNEIDQSAINSAVARYADYIDGISKEKIVNLEHYLSYYVMFSKDRDDIEEILDTLDSIIQTNVDDKNYGVVDEWFTLLDTKVKVAEQWKKDSDKAAEQKKRTQ